MATEQVNIFTNEVIEYGNIQTSGTTIDFTDWPVPGSVNPSAFTTTPFYLTATVPAQGYYEIEFMQANTFWNCNFAFGVSKCGQEIRLGIAHMIDRANFAANDPNIVAGAGVPIDLPIATTTAGNAAVANRCSWDPLSVEFGNRAGTTCAQELDSNYHGGVAYRNQTAPVTGNPSGCSTTVVSACQPQGSPDLNLAAQHFVNAGIASGFNAATSVLTGLATGISICGQAGSGCTVPNFFVRNDHLPRLDLGNAYASQICYLFTGSFTIPCTPFLTVTDGSITQFLGFQTSPNSVNKSWWFYTAGFSGPTFYDGSYFFGYDSTFASASCPTPGTASCTTIVLGGGTCNNAAVPTASAGDYQYICSPTYDSLALQLETSPCLSNTVTPNPDPLTGSNTNSSLANGQCQGTAILTSHSALLRAEDYFGRFVLTLPVFETKDQFGYLQCDPSQVVGGSCPAGSSWSRAVNDADLGLANFWTWLNTYSGRSGSGLANTIRQGFKEKIRNENPFIASTIWDVFILGNVYDSIPWNWWSHDERHHHTQPITVRHQRTIQRTLRTTNTHRHTNNSRLLGKWCWRLYMGQRCCSLFRQDPVRGRPVHIVRHHRQLRRSMHQLPSCQHASQHRLAITRIQPNCQPHLRRLWSMDLRHRIRDHWQWNLRLTCRCG